MPYRRAIITTFGGPDVLEIIEEPTLPEPGPGEVRVQVLAAGVAFTDTLIRTGSYPDVKDEPPFTPGYDMVGVIDAIGPEVAHLEVGDRVADLTVIGSNAEYLCREADGLVPVPAGLAADDAAALILSYLTAHQMLHRSAQVRPGDRVLIHGAGGAVGTALLQLGRLAGLEMYGTASAEKHAHVIAHGGTPIDYRSEDFVERIATLTEAGVDVVFESVGPANAARSTRALRRGGRLVLFGAMGGDLGSVRGKLRLVGQSIAFVVRSALRRQRRSFYSIAALRSKEPKWFRDDLAALFELATDGKLQPVIGHRTTLDNLAEAHRLVDAAAVEGKIVMTMG